MSIIDIKRNSLPVDLRMKIEHVMKEKNLSWKSALFFLASKVVSPTDVIRKSTNLFYA